jgi:hypothetical protein
MGKLG